MPLAEAGIRSNGNSWSGAIALRIRGHAPANAVVANPALANPASNCRRDIRRISLCFETLTKDSRVKIIAHFLLSARASAPIAGVLQIPYLLLLSALFGSTPPPNYSALTDFL